MPSQDAQGNKSKKRLELERKRLEDANLIEGMNSYFSFGRGGAGAPNRDLQGNILATRQNLISNPKYQHLDMTIKDDYYEVKSSRPKSNIQVNGEQVVGNQLYSPSFQHAAGQHINKLNSNFYDNSQIDRYGSPYKPNQIQNQSNYYEDFQIPKTLNPSYQGELLPDPVKYQRGLHNSFNNPIDNQYRQFANNTNSQNTARFASPHLQNTNQDYYSEQQPNYRPQVYNSNIPNNLAPIEPLNGNYYHHSNLPVQNQDPYHGNLYPYNEEQFNGSTTFLPSNIKQQGNQFYRQHPDSSQVQTIDYLPDRQYNQASSHSNKYGNTHPFEEQSFDQLVTDNGRKEKHVKFAEEPKNVSMLQHEEVVKENRSNYGKELQVQISEKKGRGITSAGTERKRKENA